MSELLTVGQILLGKVLATVTLTCRICTENVVQSNFLRGKGSMIMQRETLNTKEF